MSKIKGLKMSKECIYDVIEVRGYQFLLKSCKVLYVGAYEILEVHEDFEAKCLSAAKDTDISLLEAELLIQGLAIECTAMLVADGFDTVEITYLG